MQVEFDIKEDLSNIIKRSKQGESFDILCYITFHPNDSKSLLEYLSTNHVNNTISNVLNDCKDNYRLNKLLKLNHEFSVEDDTHDDIINETEDLFGAIIVNLNSITSTDEYLEMFCVTCDGLDELANNKVLTKYMSYKEYLVIDLSYIIDSEQRRATETALIEMLGLKDKFKTETGIMSFLNYTFNHKLFDWTSCELSVEKSGTENNSNGHKLVIKGEYSATTMFRKFMIAYKKLEFNDIINDLVTLEEPTFNSFILNTFDASMSYSGTNRNIPLLNVDNTKDVNWYNTASLDMMERIDLLLRDKHIYYMIKLDITGNFIVRTYMSETEPSAEYIEQYYKELPVNKKAVDELKIVKDMILASGQNNKIVTLDDIILYYRIDNNKRFRIPKVPFIFRIESSDNNKDIDISIQKETKSLGVNDKLYILSNSYKGDKASSTLKIHNKNKCMTTIKPVLTNDMELNIETEAKQLIIILDSKYDFIKYEHDLKLKFNISNTCNNIIVKHGRDSSSQNRFIYELSVICDRLGILLKAY